MVFIRIFNITDTYEDVIPKSERITSYLKDIISWKPTVYRRMDSQTELEHMEGPNVPFFGKENLNSCHVLFL